MSDQPISNEELTMLEAATKAAMQYQDRLAVVVDPDIMRRLIVEVRSFRAIQLETPAVETDDFERRYLTRRAGMGDDTIRPKDWKK